MELLVEINIFHRRVSTAIPGHPQFFPLTLARSKGGQKALPPAWALALHLRFGEARDKEETELFQPRKIKFFVGKVTFQRGNVFLGSDGRLDLSFSAQIPEQDRPDDDSVI